MKKEFVFLSIAFIFAVSLFLLAPSSQVAASKYLESSQDRPCGTESFQTIRELIDGDEPISLPCGTSGIIEIESDASVNSYMWMSSNYTVEEQEEDCNSYSYNPPPYYFYPWYNDYQSLIAQVNADCHAKGIAVSTSDVECGTETCNGQSRQCIPSVSPFLGCPGATVTATPPLYFPPSPNPYVGAGKCLVTYTAHAEAEIVASCDTCVNQ